MERLTFRAMFGGAAADYNANRMITAESAKMPRLAHIGAKRHLCLPPMPHAASAGTNWCRSEPVQVIGADVIALRPAA